MGVSEIFLRNAFVFQVIRLPLQSFWAEYTGAALGIGQKT